MSNRQIKKYRKNKKKIPKVLRFIYNKKETIKFIKEMKEVNKNAKLLQNSETEAIRQRRMFIFSLYKK